MTKPGIDYIRSREKRDLDLLGGAALLALSLPVATAVGLETSLEHRRLNPFFTQQRVGRGGRPYKNYKFQSLRVRDAEKKLIGGHNHPDASRVGSFLRRTGLDELPQLMNVIKGDISLVGIRPIPASFLEYYEMVASTGLFDEWYRWYLENPGLTGEGQLKNGRNGLHSPAIIRRQMEAGIQGSENASLKNDLRLIGSTPVVLFFGGLGANR